MAASDSSRPMSVDALAREIGAEIPLVHGLLVDCARRAIAVGGDVRAGALSLARELSDSLIDDVVNATGVLLHTNLGRAPVGAWGAHRRAGYRATNVELDIRNGARGSRHASVAELLRVLVGAEDAVVVNNNAAAVMLVAAALAGDGRGIAVSRGESVEIGGGFRIPEVIEQSGARLVDVGTTNKTRADDYDKVRDKVALIMRIHPSNFAMSGFVDSPALADVVAVGVPVVVDVGSGLLDASCPWLTTQGHAVPAWLHGEPAVRQAIDDGAALVTLSGDKLLGGPQCGIIAGRTDLVRACAKHPLMRALRPGAQVMRDLQDVLLAYVARTAHTDVPLWSMVTASVDELQRRADAIVARVPGSRVVEAMSLPGAGSAPSARMVSRAVSVAGDVTERLRRHRPPVIARVEGSSTLLDLRSVSPLDDEVVASALVAAAHEPSVPVDAARTTSASHGDA
jgi:L-seryl-tRNA(Ser) seleniumtransferase